MMKFELKDTGEQTSYDEIPYESHPFPQSHPDRLAMMGSLFGLALTPITQCRVLELGCASGGNLIPMAYHLPQSEFVGIDLSRRQVEMGRKIIQDLDLKNMRMENVNILDVNISWGTFDYIIAHGIYSWVPDEVQDKILAISSDNLAPHGIAYVSYNTYPGWHMREMIRRMMLYHAKQFAESNKRIEQARALMDFLSRSVPTEKNYYGLLLQNELKLIKHSNDGYLFHEHLEEINEPVYFYQFIERADRHGLQYLGEADFSTMLTSGFSKEVAETLRRISQNIIATEQYMDFIRNRLFRQTLLCHTELQLKRDIKADNFHNLLFASFMFPETIPVDLSPGIKQSFRTAKGLTIETEFPLTKAGLMVLRGHWPKAIDLNTLFDEANKRLNNSLICKKPEIEQNKRVFKDDLLYCYSANVMELHTWQADFVTEVSDKPKVSKLAAYLAGQGRVVVNQRHELVNLDLVAKKLVLILDGTRDRDALLKILLKLVEDGTLVVRQNDTILTNTKQIENVLKEMMEEALDKLASAAMLIE